MCHTYAGGLISILWSVVTHKTGVWIVPTSSVFLYPMLSTPLCMIPGSVSQGYLMSCSVIGSFPCSVFARYIPLSKAALSQTSFSFCYVSKCAQGLCYVFWSRKNLPIWRCLGHTSPGSCFRSAVTLRSAEVYGSLRRPSVFVMLFSYFNSCTPNLYFVLVMRQ